MNGPSKLIETCLIYVYCLNILFVFLTVSCNISMCYSQRIVVLIEPVCSFGSKLPLTVFAFNYSFLSINVNGLLVNLFHLPFTVLPQLICSLKLQ